MRRPDDEECDDVGEGFVGVRDGDFVGVFEGVGVGVGVFVGGLDGTTYLNVVVPATGERSVASTVTMIV